jgi:hypothetical protein
MSIRRAIQQIEAHWLGDLIGAAGLFALLFLSSFIVGAIQ